VKTLDTGIDLLRLVSIGAVVTGHIWATPLAHLVLYLWHVPFFFFLTGYLWTPQRAMSDEARRRAASLAKPYVFWLGLLYVMYFTWGHALERAEG